MKFDDPGLAAFLFREVVVGDAYCVRLLKPSCVKSVVDVGANVGLYSMLMRFWFPTAIVVAVEPDPATFAMLEENTSNLHIRCVQAGLGKSGRALALQHRGQDSGRTQYRDDATGGVKAMSIGDMLSGHQLSETVLKVDTEGAEIALVRDPEASLLLPKLYCFAAEFHCAPHFGTIGWANGFAPWLASLFGQTHDTQAVVDEQHQTTNYVAIRRP